MNRIVAILPRGEAIRNFVYSGALTELSKYCELTILSIKPNDYIFEKLHSDFSNVLLLNKYDEQAPVRYIREIIDTAHGHWLNSNASQSRTLLRNREATNITEKIKLFSKKLISYPFASTRGLEFLDKVENITGEMFRATEDYIQLFKALKPDLIFNGSQVHNKISLPVIHAAKTLNIPTSTFVFSWDNLTSQGRIYPQYDYYIVWNEYLKKELLRIYQQLSSQQILVTGTPQFDFHFRGEFHWTRETYCSEIGADPKRPIVLYTTGMANHVIGEPAIIEIIADILHEIAHTPPPQLIVRIYPKGPQSCFDDLKKNRNDILFPEVQWEQNYLTPHYEDLYHYTNSIRHADIGINIASTVSLELCMFDKPVINVNFLPPNFDISKDFDYRNYYKFEHYRSIVESGAIDIAESKEHLKALIIKWLANPDKKSSERKSLIQKFFGDTLDGKSSSRIAHTLSHLV